MTRPSEAWLPTPRQPLDDELATEWAVAAAVTVGDRQRIEAAAAARDAIARLRGES